MPKLPDVDPARHPKPKPASRYQPGAQWGGPATLGREAMLRDLALRRGWDMVDSDHAEHRFAAWTHEEDTRFDEAVASLLPAEAKGFAQRVTNDHFERAKLFRDSLPPPVRSAIDDAIVEYEQGLFNKAATAEDRAQFRAVRENLDASLRETAVPAATAVAALPADDPDKLGRFIKLKAGRFGLIDRNPALSPYEKQQRKAAEATAIDTAFAEGLSPQEKQDLDPAATIETVGERIHRLAAERQDAGRVAPADDAVGDSAAGDAASPNPEDFGWEAWLDLIRRHRKDLVEARSVVEIEALRADPELAAEMRERGLADSARFLTDNGQATSPGRLYLAHVTSPETALRLLQANPDSLAVDADPQAAPGRPDLFYVDGDRTRPRTVGAMLDLAEKAMVGTRPVDWRRELGGVSSEVQSAFAADGRTTAAQTETEAADAKQQKHRKWFEETVQKIGGGTFGFVELAKAVEEGRLSPGAEFDWLHSFIAQHQNDVRAIANYDDLTYYFNTKSPIDQRAIDLIYVQRFSGDPQAFLAGDKEAIDVVARIIARANMLPTGVQRVLAKALTSDDEVQQLRALMAINSAFAAAETKPHPEIPQTEQIAADIISAFKSGYYRKREGDRSIADAFNAFGKTADGVIRAALGLIGDFAVDAYDAATNWADSMRQQVQKTAYQFIDDEYRGYPQVFIDNRKAGVDLFLGSARYVVASFRRGRKLGAKAETGLGAESNRNLGYSKSVDGRLLPVETRIDDGVEYRVFHVKTTETRSSDAVKGTPEHRALNNPEPNAIYILDNGKRFKTNKSGFVSELEFTPIRFRRGRGVLQRIVGHGGKKTDVGGHAQAALFGGTTDRVNLFQQDKRFNVSDYKKWENRIYRNIDDAGKVKIKFLRDDPTNERPDRLHIQYEIRGERHSIDFRNDAFQ